MLRENDSFTQTYTVSEPVYTGFIALFGDQNPLHTDEHFAKEKKFQGRVMHGNILGGFLSHFIGECLPMKNVIIHSQQIQYKNPVYLEDELVLDVRVNGIFESVNAAELKFHFKNKAGSVVAQGKIQVGML